MTPDEISAALRKSLPESLSDELVEHFVSIRTDIRTGTVGGSAPGKFVETVVQVLQFMDSGSYETLPKVDQYLKNLESRPSTLSDDLRITLARVSRAMYTMRNKRSIAHKNGIDPNLYDLKILHGSAQWVLSEIVRFSTGIDVEVAGKLVEFIQTPVDRLVEDFGDKRVVLLSGAALEELLVLLRHYYPNSVGTGQIHNDMNRRKPPAISTAIKKAYDQRLIEGSRKSGYILTAWGFQASTDVAIKNAMDHGNSGK